MARSTTVERTEQPVAIKMIRKDSLSERGRYCALRETAALAVLGGWRSAPEASTDDAGDGGNGGKAAGGTHLDMPGHENIVEFFEVCEDPKHLYIVTELVEGGDLFDAAIERNVFTESDAIACARCIMRALAHCHRRNVIHRDMKPENLCFCGREPGAPLKLIDFGLAYLDPVSALWRELLSATGYGIPRSLPTAATDVTPTSLCGTPLYVAPEVLRRKPYSYPCDLWGAGVVLFILLTGYPPFDDEDDRRLYRKIRRDPVPFHLLEQNAHLSEACRDFLARLLEKDPSKRMTAEEALEHRWLASKRIERVGSTNDLHVSGRLRDFKARTRMRRAVDALVAVLRMEKMMAKKATLSPTGV